MGDHGLVRPRMPDDERGEMEEGGGNTGTPTSPSQWRAKLRRVSCGSPPSGESSSDDDPDSSLELGPGQRVPGSLARQLYPHQREAVRFLYERYASGRGGILADDMGLGKTASTIAFISAVVHCGGAAANRRGCVLVVVPMSVLAQWDAEIARWTGGYSGGRLHTAVFHGATRRDALALVRAGRADVLLTTYEMLRRELASLAEVAFACAVFDEVHRLKDRRGAVVQGCLRHLRGLRFGLTGTLMQNSFEELWTLCNFVEPGVLGPLEHCRQKYIQPILAGQRRYASRREVAVGRHTAQQLMERIRAVCLRRDKSLIAHALPQKSDEIIFCPLGDLQRAAYAGALALPEYQRLVSQAMEWEGPKGAGKPRAAMEEEDGLDAQVLAAMVRLEGLADHIGAVWLREDPEGGEAAGTSSSFLRRALGGDEQWRKVEAAMRSGDASEETRLCGKLALLDAMVGMWRTEGRKALVFSKYTAVLDALERRLRRAGHSVLRLDGSTSSAERTARLAQFQRGEGAQVFLLSSRAGSVGLNLTAASRVVIFDPSWNASTDLQAQDRVYRLGQSQDCRIYRLVSAGTIEEATYQRQIYKQQMASVGLDGRSERRYFDGVAGIRGQEGELFGVANLFRLHEGCRTRDILRQATIQEISPPQVERKEDEYDWMNSLFTYAAQEPPKKEGEEEEKEEEEEEEEEKEEEEELTKKFHEENNSLEFGRSSLPKALLEAAHVVYVHQHTLVVGESAYERKLVEEAQRELRPSDYETVGPFRPKPLAPVLDLVTTPTGAGEEESVEEWLRPSSRAARPVLQLDWTLRGPAPSSSSSSLASSSSPPQKPCSSFKPTPTSPVRKPLEWR